MTTTAEKRTTQPRTKGGKFGTSAAAARRKAEGLQPGPDPQRSTLERAKSYGRLAPDSPPEERLKAAQIVQDYAQLPATLQKAAAGPNGAMGQSLKRVMAQRLIEDSLPDAVKLLVDLVKGRGKLSRAPASVRRQAAVDLLTLGKVGEGGTAGKELSEMTVDELEAFISQTEQEITTRADQAIPIEGERVPDNPSAPIPSKFNGLDLS